MSEPLPDHLDHIISIRSAAELAARFYDLAAISDRENEAKGANITQREDDLARKWNREGLLSIEGLKEVEANSGFGSTPPASDSPLSEWEAMCRDQSTRY